MLKVLSKEMMREADSFTISNLITEEELINKAGKAVFSSYNFLGRTLIIIGRGNNGGDGLALAKLLKIEGKDVSILQVFDLEKPILLSLLSDSITLGVPVYRYSDDFKFTGYDTFVDAIYGIGFHSEITEPVKSIVEKINSLSSYTLSIDINSGLDADNGKTKLAIKSDKTVAIGYLKPGHLLNDSKDYIHELSVVNIGIPYNKNTYYCLTENDLDKIFKIRKSNTHKGTYGYVGVMGGSYKYSGSIKLSNLALISLSMGAGVTRIITPDNIADSILPFLLESTLYPITSNENGGFSFSKDEIDSATKNLSAIGFGMGIGESKDNELILEYLLRNFKKKILIDADGLNTLSRMDLSIINKSEADIVLTPHVKEFSRLINKSVEDILDNPIFYSKEFTKKYNCTLVLKGTATIISKDGEIYISPNGSVALSKGGSGDILSGIITGIMGYESGLNAALAGTYVFGMAGNKALEKYGSYSPLSRDIINILKEIMKNY